MAIPFTTEYLKTKENKDFIEKLCRLNLAAADFKSLVCLPDANGSVKQIVKRGNK